MGKPKMKLKLGEYFYSIDSFEEEIDLLTRALKLAYPNNLDFFKGIQFLESSGFPMKICWRQDFICAKHEGELRVFLFMEEKEEIMLTHTHLGKILFSLSQHLNPPYFRRFLTTPKNKAQWYYVLGLIKELKARNISAREFSRHYPKLLISNKELV